MSTPSTELRNKLERTCIAARNLVELAMKAAAVRIRCLRRWRADFN